MGAIPDRPFGPLEPVRSKHFDGCIRFNEPVERRVQTFDPTQRRHFLRAHHSTRQDGDANQRKHEKTVHWSCTHNRLHNDSPAKQP